MHVIDDDEGNGSLFGQRVLVHADLFLHSSGVERPKVGGLFDCIVLAQPFLYALDCRKVAIDIERIRSARADFPIDGHEQEQCGNGTFLHHLLLVQAAFPHRLVAV